MTTTKALNAEKRDGRGKGAARKLRATGRVPAVLYGQNFESLPLSVDAREAMHLFQTISVENTIVELEMEGEKEPVRALVREIQSHPFKPDLVHIDFMRVQKGVAVDVEIPLHLVGVPVGVKLHGGSLDQTIHELPVRCIPSRIPESIEVDVSHMELHDMIRVADLDLDDAVEVTIEPDRMVAQVSPPRGGGIEEGEEGEEAAVEAEGTTEDKGTGEEPATESEAQ